MSLTVGFVGWRGMVGSVLMDRMRAERDFDGVETVFFSTSQVGQDGPDVGDGTMPLRDARDTSVLKDMDVVLTCQGGDYTKEMHPRLREEGWKGYWIDAASSLRMADESVLILDPVNEDVIRRGLASGLLDYIGGNCTVSLMLMAVGGLLRQGLVEWVSTMTYQAASGAGARNMRELLLQMRALGNAPGKLLDDPAGAILDVDREVTRVLRSGELPTAEFGAALAGSLLPWIDRAVADGQTREEWKGHVETNKILQSDPEIPVDGICVRVGAMRCHSQGLTLRLKRDVPLDDVESILAESNDWVEIVPNEKSATLAKLTPTYAAGTLAVPVGRIRKMKMGGQFLTCFTVGDQLLWGAAEPLRRMLRILREHLE